MSLRSAAPSPTATGWRSPATAGARSRSTAAPAACRCGSTARGARSIATAPSPRRLPEAAAFARERAAWIAERLAELPDARADPAAGDDPAACSASRCGWSRGPAARQMDRRPPTTSPARIGAMGEGEGYARAGDPGCSEARALAVLTERTAVYCAPAGRADAEGARSSTPRAAGAPAGRACRGRPASIRYSWRLALAPFAVADYVAAHECAHLLELNHGPRFWAHVKALVGDSAATAPGSGPKARRTRCTPSAARTGTAVLPRRFRRDEAGLRIRRGRRRGRPSPAGGAIGALVAASVVALQQVEDARRSRRWVGCAGGGGASPPGIGWTFRRGRAAAMKSCQMPAGAPPPVTLLHRRCCRRGRPRRR